MRLTEIECNKFLNIYSKEFGRIGVVDLLRKRIAQAIGDIPMTMTVLAVIGLVLTAIQIAISLWRK